MIKCIECNIETENAKGWYAELSEKGKLMRCSSCGKKEEDLRWKMKYGDRKKPSSFEEVDKQNRIQYAKDLRNAGIGPWQYQQLL